MRFYIGGRKTLETMLFDLFFYLVVFLASIAVVVEYSMAGTSERRTNIKPES